MKPRTYVLKLGGTSVETVDRMAEIARQVSANFSGNTIYAVVSAMGDTTDRIRKAVSDAEKGVYARPEEVYEPFDVARERVSSHLIEGYAHAIYRKFHEILERAVTSPKDTDYLHMTGEMLAGCMLDEVFRQSGMESKYIPYNNSGFPVAVKGEFGLATPDLREIKDISQRTRHKEGIVVFPGYGGVDGRCLKTLGNGGSDAAAFCIAYGHKADEVRIVTDVPGLKASDIKNAGVIPEIDINEAYAIGFSGAKFPTHKAFVPVIQAYKEGSEMEIHVVPFENLSSSGTTIRKETNYKSPIKFVGGRRIKTYVVEGDWRQLVNGLYDSGIDWFYYGTGMEGRLNIGVSERTTNKFLERVEKSNGRISVMQSDAAIICVVGNGMEKPGIKGKVETALGEAGISLPYTIDPNDVSFGHIIEAKDLSMAKEAVYNSLINK